MVIADVDRVCPVAAVDEAGPEEIGVQEVVARPAEKRVIPEPPSSVSLPAPPTRLSLPLPP